jgi:hypothetical protein
MENKSHYVKEKEEEKKSDRIIGLQETLQMNTKMQQLHYNSVDKPFLDSFNIEENLNSVHTSSYRSHSTSGN